MTAVFDKLLNGIKAAMVLTGIVILFGITASVSACRDFFHARQWTYTGIHETFLAMILLGMLLGWCFPAKVKKYCPALFVVPSILLFLLGNLYLSIGENKPSPQEMKLADCSQSIVNIHLTAPKGRHYVLFLHGSSISSYKFTGHLRIKGNKSQTTDIPLNSDKMFVSPGELDLGSVNIEAGKDYDLQIEFNPPPPPSSFISLYWMENAAERRANERLLASP